MTVVVSSPFEPQPAASAAVATRATSAASGRASRLTGGRRQPQLELGAPAGASASVSEPSIRSASSRAIASPRPEPLTSSPV